MYTPPSYFFCYSTLREFLHGSSLALCFFFFFSSRRRHTRSTRDWSSDVCSSDLADFLNERHHAVAAEDGVQHVGLVVQNPTLQFRCQFGGFREAVTEQEQPKAIRSEERRVGKECRYRGRR